MQIRLFLLVSFMALLLGGCTTPIKEKPTPRKAEQELSSGIKNYEDGNFKVASIHLQNALASGLSSNNDTLKAHKHLAFIYCVTDQEKPCRDEFRKALNKDSKFELTPAEVGHPIWGPVFRSIKAERKK